jgi:hypothetical protein
MVLFREDDVSKIRAMRFLSQRLKNKIAFTHVS